MSFLAFVIALALHQVLKAGNVLQRDGWLLDYERFLSGFLSSPGLRLFALSLTLLFVGGWALEFLGGLLFGLPALAFIAVTLVWSLGRDDYHTALECFEARVSTDPASACEAIDELWAPLGEPNAPLDGDTADRAQALERLAYSGYARWFAPVFFFVVTGPMGAVLYRAIAVLAREGRDPVYQTALHWLDWIPSRLVALTFALTGDFMAVVHNHPLRWFLADRSVPCILKETSACACSGADGARAIHSIMYRSAGLWLLLISAGFILL